MSVHCYNRILLNITIFISINISWLSGGKPIQKEKKRHDTFINVTKLLEATTMSWYMLVSNKSAYQTTRNPSLHDTGLLQDLRVSCRSEYYLRSGLLLLHVDLNIMSDGLPALYHGACCIFSARSMITTSRHGPAGGPHSVFLLEGRKTSLERA